MKEYGVALFYSTHEAIKAEKAGKQAGIIVRVIPTPEKIYASCGFSLKYPLESEKELRCVLSEHKILSEGFYRTIQEGLNTAYYLQGGE